MKNNINDIIGLARNKSKEYIQSQKDFRNNSLSSSQMLIDKYKDKSPFERNKTELKIGVFLRLCCQVVGSLLAAGGLYYLLLPYFLPVFSSNTPFILGLFTIVLFGGFEALKTSQMTKTIELFVRSQVLKTPFPFYLNLVILTFVSGSVISTFYGGEEMNLVLNDDSKNIRLSFANSIDSINSIYDSYIQTEKATAKANIINYDKTIKELSNNILDNKGTDWRSNTKRTNDTKSLESFKEMKANEANSLEKSLLDLDKKRATKIELITSRNVVQSKENEGNVSSGGKTYAIISLSTEVISLMLFFMIGFIHSSELKYQDLHNSLVEVSDSANTELNQFNNSVTPVQENNTTESTKNDLNLVKSSAKPVQQKSNTIGFNLRGKESKNINHNINNDALTTLKERNNDLYSNYISLNITNTENRSINELDRLGVLSKSTYYYWKRKIEG